MLLGAFHLLPACVTSAPGLLTLIAVFLPHPSFVTQTFQARPLSYLYTQFTCCSFACHTPSGLCRSHSFSSLPLSSKQHLPEQRSLAIHCKAATSICFLQQPPLLLILDTNRCVRSLISLTSVLCASYLATTMCSENEYYISQPIPRAHICHVVTYSDLAFARNELLSVPTVSLPHSHQTLGKLIFLLCIYLSLSCFVFLCEKGPQYK